MTSTSSLRHALSAAWPAHESRVKRAFFASLTLGLAPFYPHAHVWKQLMNIVHGTLTEPLDIFDLFLHGAPWVALFGFTGWLLVDAVRNHSKRPAEQVSAT